MESNRDEQRIARSDSWKTMEMPVAFIPLPLSKTYTAEEFNVIARGVVPEAMEDRWFIFIQDDTLFFHRSWTGLWVYKVIFEQKCLGYIIREALMNGDPNQYNARDNRYEVALLGWLIDGLDFA